MISFLAYGGAIFGTLRGGRDCLLQTQLGSGDAPLQFGRIIAAALIVSAMIDAVIVAAQIAGFGEWQGVIISLFSYANLFTLGLLGMSGSLASVAEPEVAVTLLPTESDAEIMAKVRSLMAIRKSYLDPNFTFSQIARRLRRPAKVVSAAINRNRGENVSRYITAYRVNHAANLLIAVETATQAMLAAGFNTKSSFNREYLRVQGVSPACWLATQHNVGKSASYRR